ncbi:MAG: iron-sulfur cluster assembly scaffold protein [Chlamydiales bacterium]|nr:iron-sulfur cluster assembly scaffold protein [Chlamydiales bacterium]
MKPIWSRFSKKMVQKITNPRNFGYFTQEDAVLRKMRFVQGKEGFVIDGNAVAFYWLVDESDGMIVDAKFQMVGESALIAACEEACLLVVGKNYDQAKRISADLIDKQLRDHPDKEAFPSEVRAHLNLVIDAIDDAVEKCLDLPLPESYVSPVPHAIKGDGYPGFEELSHAKKLAVIEHVIEEEIRPYIELDAGGIEVQELTDTELKIAYQGSCTSCFSAIGATLSTIQEIISAKVHPNLKVVPDMEALNL